MKKLSAEGRFDSNIDEMLAGKVWAFTSVIAHDGIGLGAAVANEPGYYPIPLSFAFVEFGQDAYDEMSAHADELNEAMGLDEEAAMKIVASSMFPAKRKARA